MLIKVSIKYYYMDIIMTIIASANYYSYSCLGSSGCQASGGEAVKPSDVFRKWARALSLVAP